MTINNEKTVIRINITYLVLSIIVLPIIFMFTVAGKGDYLPLGINKYIIVFLLGGVYIAYLAHKYIKKHNYIFFSDDADKIAFRHFSITISSIFGSSKRAIEIPKNAFAGAIYYHYGVTESISLLQKQGNKVASYPTVSIASLTKQEKTAMLNTLKKYSLQEKTSK